MEKRTFQTDLAVIGSGLAGMAASVFALNRSITTSQAGNTGALAYTTGYLDLLGDIGPGSTGTLIQDPWQGLSELKKTQPNHPLAQLSQADIQTAFTEFTSFIGQCGISYSAPGSSNLTALTPAGTTKTTLCAPVTMTPGIDGLANQKRCLVIDFTGLRGFSGRQVVANLKECWPEVTSERITFPDMASGEIYPEVMARALEVKGTRVKLSEAIQAVKGEAEIIGLPAILGMHTPEAVMADLEQLLGCPVFEIPTMPPSVPGIRLREMFEQEFPKRGLTLVPQQKVDNVSFTDDQVILSLTDNFGPIEMCAKAVILATGRFLSGGLEANHDRISEPLLNLPVSQPTSRNDWYNTSYMGREGHLIHQAGIEVDEHFRPLGQDNTVVSKRLFAAGVILAHQDWIRGRCGAGVAISTAYKAVQGVEQLLS